MEDELFQDLMKSIEEAGAMLRAMPPSGAKNAVEAMTQVIVSDGHLPPNRVTDKAFEKLTGVEARTLWDWVLGKGELPCVPGARRLQEHLSDLLRCTPEEAATLLGVSDGHIERDDHLSGEMLDRAYAILGTYVYVASIIGPLSAPLWFSEPNVSLAEQAPARLLGTHVGRSAIVDLVDALLPGSHV